eukprot:94166-Alexandrium_andersonii.AAC.1
MSKSAPPHARQAPPACAIYPPAMTTAAGTVATAQSEMMAKTRFPEERGQASPAATVEAAQPHALSIAIA